MPRADHIPDRRGGGVSLLRATRRRRSRPTRCIDEQWAFSPDTRLRPARRLGALRRAPGSWSRSSTRGMKLDHPDLAPNVWTNFGEVPGNGVDDDGNGYVDDVHGVDLTTAGANQDLHDGFGHGTHVAGTIAAAANGRGVVGVAFRAKLMTVKVLDDGGAGTTGAVAEGIRYAAANGARIINLSLESSTDDPRMRAAVEAAAAANALVVSGAATAAPTSTASRVTRSRSRPRTSSASPRPSPRRAARCRTSPTTAGSPCRWPRPASTSSRRR